MTVSTATRVTRTAARRRPSTRKTPRWMLVALEIVVPILLVALWWVLSADSTNTFFPPLQTILQTLVQDLSNPVFLADVGASLLNLLISFVLASVLGVVLGTLLGLVRWVSWLTEPTMHFFRAIPPVALVPIFVAILGFGNETRILSITLAALFPTLIATLDGVRAMDPTMGMVTRVYGLTRGQRIFRVTLPAASPRIFSGMQVSLQTAFIVMIASEMLGSSTGLGAVTLQAQQSFMIAQMWAGIIVLGVIGYVASALFALLRGRVLRWYIRSQQIGREA
ncbi:nitrate ABC transporter permease [Microbacterium mangrovi]|uniref:Nitrate ABC transporter permease n=1 Tax=Microbacterium mangrovi TaxID=1348253 RepID=A0A0B1ZWA0_9MICO|nr:ABC transporter permease [Microbacterium mangrovi]KHK95483.1 nitrate ABC transporter permease [Microbacterium mangrovi]